MKVNPFYITWGIISLLLVGGAGFFLFSSKSAYDSTKGSFDDKEVTIERLQKKAPVPSSKSVKEMEKLVADYEADVNELYSSLATYQRPLRTDLTDAQFQEDVFKKREAFFTAAKASNLEIEDKNEFYFGMERYRETLPSPANVPLLAYQLEAIDRMLAILVDNGAEQLLDLKRELLPTEVAPNEPDPTLGQSVVRYELRVEFLAPFDAYQKFINELANDKEFFYLLRVIRVDNTSPNGPAGNDGPVMLGGSMEFISNAGESPSAELKAEAEQIDDIGERVSFYNERGYAPVGEDARVLFGDERVRVFAVVDVARFPTPNEQAANGDAGADSGTSGNSKKSKR